LKLQTILKTVILSSALAMVACSPSASSLKKVLSDNPDILHAAIEADPKGFFETVQKVQAKAREQSMEDQMSGELKRVQEEMKAPKAVEIDDARAVVGPANAPITIVEWADFNCGHCSSANDTVVKILETYGDKVRFLYKHLPILAKESKVAAEYMEAIAMQDKEKAIKFKHTLFANQKEIRSGGEDYLKKAAKEVGADLAKLQKDRKSDTVKKRIDSDVAEAQKFEFNGTPGFMINGASVHGAYPFDFFKKVIDAVLSGKQS
jgi:protein-disulfide isomerase